MSGRDDVTLKLVALLGNYVKAALKENPRDKAIYKIITAKRYVKAEGTGK